MKLYKVAAAALLLQTSLLGTAYAQALNGNPLSDVRVRQAIAYAIDKKAIVDNVYGGYATVLLPFSQTVWGQLSFRWEKAPFDELMAAAAGVKLRLEK